MCAKVKSQYVKYQYVLCEHALMYMLNYLEMHQTMTPAVYRAMNGKNVPSSPFILQLQILNLSKLSWLSLFNVSSSLTRKKEITPNRTQSNLTSHNPQKQPKQTPNPPRQQHSYRQLPYTMLQRILPDSTRCLLEPSELLGGDLLWLDLPAVFPGFTVHSSALGFAALRITNILTT